MVGSEDPERLRTGPISPPKQRQHVSPPPSTILPSNYRHLQHPRPRQAEIGLKRKCVSIGKCERVGKLRRLALASLDICNCIRRVAMQFSMRLCNSALNNRMLSKARRNRESLSIAEGFKPSHKIRNNRAATRLPKRLNKDKLVLLLFPPLAVRVRTIIR